VVDVAERLEELWAEKPGLADFIGTVDHKRIGKRYLYTAIVFFIVGGLEAALIRIQLSHANLHVLNPELYDQIFTMHALTMIFLFVIPALSGFGNFVVPLQVGARDMAFPRLNAFGYWVFLMSGIFFMGSFVVGRAPDAGWFSYVPLAGARYTPGVNSDFYALGVIFVSISSTAGAINFIVTIAKMRAPGMSINRIPLFCWGELAMAISSVFAFPSLTLAALMLELERRLGFHFYDAAKGGDPILWQHLFWIFGHPIVYIIILPALGIAASVIPTFARRPMIGYAWIVLGEMAVGLLGFGVWVHHMFSVGLPAISLSMISITSFVITIPSGIVVLAWIATIFSGRIITKTPMLFILGFILIFVIGGLSGVMFAAIPFDQATTDSYFVVAHFHYVMAGGAMFPIFAAIYYWGPKMTGRLLNEFWGKISFWVMFIGFNVGFFPMHITGLMGEPRRVYTYQPGLGWDVWSMIETIGTFIFSVGALITLINWWWSARNGPPAGNDPFGADTLEFGTTSPPPHYNFERIPTVRSRHPVWDQPELRGGDQPPDAGGRALDDAHVTLSTSVLDARPQALIHMPHESGYPFVLATSLLVLFFGLLTGSLIVIGAGALFATASIVGWLWPRGQTQET
jgi:cytochrome c oxidase subunit 1/cytochrome c oxidase subunit I+III